jgi:hypothetical protein
MRGSNKCKYYSFWWTRPVLEPTIYDARVEYAPTITPPMQFTWLNSNHILAITKGPNICIEFINFLMSLISLLHQISPHHIFSINNFKFYMLRVIDIKVICDQKQIQCLHGVLLCYIWVEFVKIVDCRLVMELAYCSRKL